MVSDKFPVANMVILKVAVAAARNSHKPLLNVHYMLYVWVSIEIALYSALQRCGLFPVVIRLMRYDAFHCFDFY